jgi:hypothetical protein
MKVNVAKASQGMYVSACFQLQPCNKPRSAIYRLWKATTDAARQLYRRLPFADGTPYRQRGPE